MPALGASSQQDAEPARPKGVVAISIGERAAQFAPTFAKQYHGNFFGRNIAAHKLDTERDRDDSIARFLFEDRAKYARTQSRLRIMHTSTMDPCTQGAVLA